MGRYSPPLAYWMWRQRTLGYPGAGPSSAASSAANKGGSVLLSGQPILLSGGSVTYGPALSLTLNSQAVLLSGANITKAA